MVARKTFRKRHGKKPTLKKKVAKLFKLVKIQKPETKWTVINSVSSTTSYAGTTISMVDALTQGDSDFGQRNGDTIRISGLRSRIQLQTGSTTIPTLYRVIWYTFKHDPDGATSSASILNLLLHSTHMSTINAPLTPYDHDNRSSFVVHSDRLYQFNPMTGSSTGGTNCSVAKTLASSIKIPESCKKVQYFAGGSTTTKNELFCSIISDTSYTIPIAYNFTLYYTDA